MIYISVQEGLLADLSAVRELSVKLDQMRDSLSRQLASKSMDKEEVINNISLDNITNLVRFSTKIFLLCKHVCICTRTYCIFRSGLSCDSVISR